MSPPGRPKGEYRSAQHGGYQVTHVPAAGLPDPVHDAQRAFRIALSAMSRPATVHTLGAPIPDVPLGGAMARLLLALTDEDTPVWWQHAQPQLRQWLRFHTGARPVPAAGEASFAVITEAAALPELQSFQNGSLEAPEQSCTLLVEVPTLHGGLAVQTHGPGLRTQASLDIAGLPEGFWAEWQASHALFPQGVDIFFTCGDQVLGLPRTTRIGRLQGI
ncbi:MAG TPA: phosphonate C-P lyase system protein PhnH [Ramlibacter sp.]|nr:phosphonate C-P lyase system protein PhnH [Ramlibacter sp.]